MLVTPEGMVTLTRLLQPEKAPTPMLVTPLGMVKELPFPVGYLTKVVLSLLYNTPSTEL
jgi:hypothetical protein